MAGLRIRLLHHSQSVRVASVTNIGQTLHVNGAIDFTDDAEGEADLLIRL